MAKQEDVADMTPDLVTKIGGKVGESQLRRFLVIKILMRNSIDKRFFNCISELSG